MVPVLQKQGERKSKSKAYVCAVKRVCCEACVRVVLCEKEEQMKACVHVVMCEKGEQKEM